LTCLKWKQKRYDTCFRLHGQNDERLRDDRRRRIRADSRFYAQVPDDPILGPMYPKDDLAGARALRDFSSAGSAAAALHRAARASAAAHAAYAVCD
jgi:hypothetical protein